MFLIGLTGNIASGKSTVSKIFQNEFKVPIVDADLIARQVVEPNTTGWTRIKILFGTDILNADNTLNRDKLGKIIFQNEQKRKALNRALHGLIRIEMLKQIFLYLIQGYTFIILDIPLLFETKTPIAKLISYTLVVDCDEQTQLKRLLTRNPELSEQDALNRINSQMKRELKLKLADYVIDNSTYLETTRNQCEKLFKIFNNSNKHWYFRTALLSGSILMLISIFYFFL